MKIEIKKAKKRNPLHEHPLMKKGGIHKKSNKALRKQNKQAMLKEQAEPILFH